MEGTTRKSDARSDAERSVPRMEEPREPPRLSSARALVASLLLCTAALALSSCAYYNTFYLARKNYMRATEGLPYAVEKPANTQTTYYTKAIDYSKKVIAVYPKSKWVDDAYLMWARSLLGREDPSQTVNMLREFPTRYPKSPLENEVTFYLGVGYRQSRKYADAVTTFDEFLAKEPKHELTPYAYYEKARALVSLDRPGEAAEAAAAVAEEFPKSALVDRALWVRAEALLAKGDYSHARESFKVLGTRARTDQERFDLLLREADCLEAGRDYAAELSLLNDALSHEPEPAIVDTSTRVFNVSMDPATQRYGRLQIRVGTVHMLEGRKTEALRSYERTIASYPGTALAAEAQFRKGYVHENLADDFENARTEYGKVRTHSASSAFATQAMSRIANLERLAQYRTAAAGDTATRKIEAQFLLAEQYLFQLDKPDRAVEEYREIAKQNPGSPLAGKALNAQAWVLRNRMDQKKSADSLFWLVIRDYPATPAQIAARDYLELAGQSVPESLIRYPEVPVEPLIEETVSPEQERRNEAARLDSMIKVAFTGKGGAPTPRPGRNTGAIGRRLSPLDEPLRPWSATERSTVPPVLPTRPQRDSLDRVLPDSTRRGTAPRDSVGSEMMRRTTTPDSLRR